MYVKNNEANIWKNECDDFGVGLEFLHASKLAKMNLAATQAGVLRVSRIKTFISVRIELYILSHTKHVLKLNMKWIRYKSH